MIHISKHPGPRGITTLQVSCALIKMNININKMTHELQDEIGKMLGCSGSNIRYHLTKIREEMQDISILDKNREKVVEIVHTPSKITKNYFTEEGTPEGRKVIGLLESQIRRALDAIDSAREMMAKTEEPGWLKLQLEWEKVLTNLIKHVAPLANEFKGDAEGNIIVEYNYIPESELKRHRDNE